MQALHRHLPPGPPVHAENHLGGTDMRAVRNLRMVFWLNTGFAVLEAFGGVWTNSVSILSDALHDFGDSVAIGLAWWLQAKSAQTPTDQFTYGYQRFSLLGALLNGLILMVGGVFILREAMNRLQHPEPSDALGMLAFSVLGIVINGLAAWRAGGGKSLNERVLTWHLLEDVLGWVAIGLASCVLWFRPDWMWLDPALSLAITVWVLWNVLRRLFETLRVFLQARPEDIDIGAVRKAVQSVPAVHSIHACRVWSLDGERTVFSVHVVLSGLQNVGEVAAVKGQILEAVALWSFHDITIETEFLEPASNQLLGDKFIE
jgi:cobalt-zinc-cadmium efflux system protein